MPITSHQMSGMIGGQQAMFGNFASYSQQISPGFQGQPPTYANPMAGSGSNFSPPPMPMQDPNTMNVGPRAMSAIGNIGIPALGTAAMIGGSMLPGALGSAIGGLDPFTGGLKGFASGAGLRAGGAGIMSNLGRIASGGLGSIAKAGLGGLGGAAAGFLPMYAAGKAAQYGVGQMVQGAQFQNQVQGVLDQNFRFQNTQAHSGYGFSRDQGSSIANMVREMGHSDMMTGPQELLRVMKGGAQQGLFRAVQDVKEFKKRFTDMVGSLKEVAKTMNTTLEGAMPFFAESRQMGFWTPSDITRHAQQTKQTAAASGLSVSHTQQMMAQGAQMARSVGAMGATGAQGMGQSLSLVGGGLRGGTISERELSEATGGLAGPQAVQSLGGTLQAATTRFARSRRARWALAAMGRNGFTSLDPGKMQDMMSGAMSLSDVSQGARKNIGEQGAFNFVNNEKELRGELIKQGPMAQLGFIRTMIGSRLYGDDPKDKLIRRRLMQRNFGVGGKQADILSKLARDAPQIQAMNEARGSAAVDQQERDQERIMSHSWEGVKRKASNWWDKVVKERFQKFGAEIGKAAGDYYEKASDKLWGSTPTRHRARGIGELGMEALQRGAMGDTRIMEQTFGKAGDFYKNFGAPGEDLGGGQLGKAGGGTATGRWLQRLTGSFGGNEGGIGNFFANVTNSGVRSNAKIDTYLSLGARERSFATADERDEAIAGGNLVGGRYFGKGNDPFRAFDRGELSRIRAGTAAGATGKVSSQEQAGALGYGDASGANKALEGARAEMGTDFKRAATGLAIKHDVSGRALGRLQVAEIMAGRMGSSKLRDFIKKGKDMNQRVNLLAAAQSGDWRGSRGGVDLTEEAQNLDIGVFSGMEDMEKRVGAHIEAAETAVASAVAGGGLFGLMTESAAARSTFPKATQDVMEGIAKKGGAEFKRAMMLMASGRNPEEKAANKARAREILVGLASDKEMDSTEAATLHALTNEKHPKAKEIQDGMKRLGQGFQYQERLKFAETAMRRGARFTRNLGKQRDEFMGRLNKITGKGGVGLGNLVEGLTKVKSPEEYLEKMQQIVQLAGEADEGEVAQAAEDIRSIGGGEEVVAALVGSRQVSGLVKDLTSNKARTVMGAANRAMGGLLGEKGISLKQMQAIKGEDAGARGAAIDSIVGDAPSKSQKKVRELLGLIADGKIAELTEGMSGKVVADALNRLSPNNILKDRADDLRGRIDVLGETGSAKGMHVEMTRQTKFLQEISSAIHEGLNVEYKTVAPSEPATNS